MQRCSGWHLIREAIYLLHCRTALHLLISVSAEVLIICMMCLYLPVPQEYHQQYLSKGGRFKAPQSAEKGCKDKIRCYG